MLDLSECDVLEILRVAIAKTEPDFSTAKQFTRPGDVFVCKAPSDIGRALALKQKLRGENQQLSNSHPGCEENLLWMQLLDVAIRLMVRRCAPKDVNPASVRVCVEGNIKIPRELVEQAAA